MEVKLQDIPSVFEGQYTDDINGNTLYYNPFGYGGVTVVDSTTQVLLGLCNGKNTVGKIIEFDNRFEEIAKDELDLLAEREVIKISDQFTQELHIGLWKKPKMSCWLHLTNNCNLACSYCYIHKTPGKMTLETGKLAIDKMLESCACHDTETLEIKFAGGEPMLSFGLLKELVDYSQIKRGNINVEYSIATNGTLATKEIADYLKLHNIGIGVSLDGIDRVNDVCRFDKNGNGSFESVIKGLSILRDSGNDPSIMTTVSSSNYSNLVELTKFFLENNYNFRFSLERDCDTGKPEILLFQQDVISELHKAYDYIEDHLPSKDIMYIHKFGDVTFRMPLNRSCCAGKNFFAIGHDGQLGICGMGLCKPFSNINIYGDLLDDVRDHCSEFSMNVASTYSGCSSCVWKKSCAGACPMQTKASYGAYNMRSPYCEIYKQILPRLLRIKGLQMIRDSNLSV